MVPEKKKKYNYDYINRYLCDVIDEMRTANKSRNYSYLEGLIEEVQVMGNRMESALEENRSVRQAHERLEDLKKEYNELIVQYNNLVDKFPKESDNA